MEFKAYKVMNKGDNSMEFKMEPIDINFHLGDQIKEDIKKEIDSYHQNRLFSDDILMHLLEDKIIESGNKIIEEVEKREEEQKRTEIDSFIGSIRKIIFNDEATIIFWDDGTKTVVKCDIDDYYDREKGIALCIVKHLFGDIGYYNEIFKSFEPKKDSKNKNIYYPTKKARKRAAKACFRKFLFK